MNKLLIGVVVVLAIAVSAAYFFLAGSGGSAVPSEAPDSDSEAVGRNTVLYGALLAGGLVNPFASVDEKQAYAAYELPEGYDADVSQKYAFGAAASSAPQGGKIVVVQYVGSTAKKMWSGSSADVDAWASGELKDEQFEGKIEKKEV